MKYKNQGFIVKAVGGGVDDGARVDFISECENYEQANSMFTKMCAKCFHQDISLYHVELDVMLQAENDNDGETGGYTVLKETTFENIEQIAE